MFDNARNHSKYAKDALRVCKNEHERWWKECKANEKYLYSGCTTCKWWLVSINDYRKWNSKRSEKCLDGRWFMANNRTMISNSMHY